MIRHAFMLIWNRKGANTLLMLELLVTFLILFALAAFSLNLYRLYGKPLGFNVANTWSITALPATGRDFIAADNATFQQVRAVAQQFDEVAAVELISDLPFDALSNNEWFVTVGNMNNELVAMNVVSPGFPEAAGMTLLEGRWFGPEDDAQSAETESITPQLVNKAFSDKAGGNVVGKLIPLGPLGQRRIVGVFEEFRQDGQFSAIKPLMLLQQRDDADMLEAPSLVLVLKPGIPAGFEERLLEELQRAAPGWDFDVNTWESLQENHFRLFMIPLMIVSGVVLFLLVMVGFGLLGVLWQNVIRRTPEMGLRRAMGATAGAVRLQVVLELLAVASLALVLGIAIVVQFPLAGIIPPLDWTLFVPAVTMSTSILLLLCILFALYPSYQATRQDPVEALRYE